MVLLLRPAITATEQTARPISVLYAQKIRYATIFCYMNGEKGFAYNSRGSFARCLKAISGLIGDVLIEGPRFALSLQKKRRIVRKAYDSAPPPDAYTEMAAPVPPDQELTASKEPPRYQVPHPRNAAD